MNKIVAVFIVGVLLLMNSAIATDYNMTAGNNYELDYEFNLSDMDATIWFKFISPYLLESGTPELDMLWIESNNRTVEPCYNETTENTFKLLCPHKFNESEYNMTVHIRLHPAIVGGAYQHEFSVISYSENKQPSGSGSHYNSPSYKNTKTINVKYVQAPPLPPIEEPQVDEPETPFIEDKSPRILKNETKIPTPIKDEPDTPPKGNGLLMGLLGVGAGLGLLYAAKKRKKKGD